MLWIVENKLDKLVGPIMYDVNWDYFVRNKIVIIGLTEGKQVLYTGEVDPQYMKQNILIPHGPGCFFFEDQKFVEGYFHQGQVSRISRAIYSNGGLYQGEWQLTRYHGKGFVIRGGGKRPNPATVEGMQEEGNFVDEKRVGIFKYTTPTKQQAKLRFEDNILVEIIEDNSNWQIFKKMLRDSQKFWEQEWQQPVKTETDKIKMLLNDLENIKGVPLGKINEIRFEF